MITNTVPTSDAERAASTLRPWASWSPLSGEAPPAGRVLVELVDDLATIPDPLSACWAMSAATEAVFLLAAHAFEGLGNRRLEWKCDARNVRSRRAAERFGFTYEGTFRQDQIVKGRNRDTAWFSLLDGEWPTAGAAFRAWLDPANLAADGTQRRGLADLRAGLRDARASS